MIAAAPDVPPGRTACVPSDRDGSEPPRGPSRIVADLVHQLLRRSVTVPHHEHGPHLAEVTNAVVRLYRTYYGKGPTRSKSYLMDDLLVCIMRELFTTIEHTLIEAGEARQVRATRLALREAIQEELRAEVERIVGRRVRGLTGQVLLAPEIAIEVFVLEPRQP
jgi:uncharacterized protein YbcI